MFREMFQSGELQELMARTYGVRDTGRGTAAAVAWLCEEVGGLAQGVTQNDPSMSFIQSVASVLPYLRGGTVAAFLLTISHFIFAFHFGLMLFGLGRTSTVPTFLNPVEAEGAEPHL